jgi:hypothetical protein
MMMMKKKDLKKFVFPKPEVKVFPSTPEATTTPSPSKKQCLQIR